ncbi:hypothetical protein L1987_87537 [Smallanthus sonchifolius]|nr:hypothetical protein L1987_87537 [Smallanthus sonchifolius]
MLILAGTAIVNEAILTGESTPNESWLTFLKYQSWTEGPEERLSSKRDKNHVLFGGTKIFQHTPDKTFHMKTPDGGCLAIVLRTGFETTLGKLNTWETCSSSCYRRFKRCGREQTSTEKGLKTKNINRKRSRNNFFWLGYTRFW